MVADESHDDKTQSFLALTSGTSVLHYKILEKIGAGGMGEVYLALDTKLNRKVALKFLPPHLCRDDDCRKRFTREAQAAAKLDHPNIVPVYEVGEFMERPFFAMAHIEGRSLREIIKGGKLSIPDAVGFTMQICEGLHKAHESGVVHRDIKPSNIIIDAENRARIVDFGLATVSGEEKLTKTGSTLGTVGYMSPEQVEGKQVDHRSDLFSVGVILYEMLTGRRPFGGHTDAAVARSITDTPPEPIARYKSGTTGELQQIVDKALTKDPTLRYQHADGMLADLRRLQLGASSATKSRVGLWIAVVAIVVVSIVAYYASTRFAVTPKPEEPGWTNSIAVLVFRDQSPNRDQDYFCEGMTDAIIGRLSNINNLKVISLTSVLKIKDSDYDLKKIGRMLDVEHILEGSILKERDRIRIRVQLIDVDHDAHLWSDQFDQRVESIFDVQDDISKAIVDVMKIELMGNEESTLVKRNTDNLEAFNEYTQGRYFWRKRTEDGIKKSIGHFERAIELDSAFALAYSGLADAWAVLPGYSNVPRAEVEFKQMEAAKMAIRLDDSLAEAHTSMAWAYWIYLRDVENAEIEFQRALEINPCYSLARIWHGNMIEAWWQDLDGKKRELEKALDCDPLSVVALNNLAALNSEDSNFVEAIKLMERLSEIEPDNGLFQANFGGYYLRAGKLELAMKHFENSIELEPTLWDNYHVIAQRLFSHGYPDSAEQIWNRAISTYADQPANYSNYGYYIKDNFRNYDSAIVLFEKAISLDPEYDLAYIGMAIALDSIKSYDKAIWAARQAIRASPNELDHYKNLGAIYYHAGRLDSSVNSYLVYLNRRAGDLNTISITGHIAILDRQYILADSLFNVIANHSVSSQRAAGRTHKPMILLHQGKFKKALDEFESYIKLDRDDVGDHMHHMAKYFMRGKIFYLLGNVDSALVQYQIARNMMQEIDSTHHWMVLIECNIAETYAFMGDTTKVNKIINRLSNEIEKSDSTRNTYLYHMMSRAQYHYGKYDSAITLLEEKMGFGGKGTNTLRALGQCYLAAGRISEAIDTYENAFTVFNSARYYYPHWMVLAHYELGQAYEAAGRTDDAIEQYETFLDIWKDADGGLESVKDARERLAKLKDGR